MDIAKLKADLNNFRTKPYAIPLLATLILIPSLALSVVKMNDQKNLNTFAAGTDAIVTVDLNAPDKVSNMTTGATHTQHSLDPWGNAVAISSGKQLLTSSTTYQNQHIFGWGTLNPEPAPGQYDWELLDSRVQLMRDTGGVKVITLCCAPDWMKGGQPGQTDWSKLEVAPLPEYYDDFAELSKRVAMRYPDVEYFQVWNEFKGFYNASLNRWNYEGYTQMYNLVYDAIKSVRPNAKIGGPYVVMDHWPDTGAGGWPAQEPELYNQPWGTMDRRALDVISYWLANKHGAEFITIDGGTSARGGTWPTDEFTAAQFFVATVEWIRKQPNGGATLPIWWAEWYANIQNQDNNPDHYNAVMANALIATLRSGAALPLIWEPQGNAQGFSFPEALFTDTQITGGGQATPFYYTQKTLKDFFGPGTQLYKFTSSSNDITGIASAAKTLLVNKTNAAKSITVNGNTIMLNPYHVLTIDTPRATNAPFPTNTPIASPIPTLAPQVPTATPTPRPTSMPIPTNTPTPLSNLLKNGSFENGSTSWYLQVTAPATAKLAVVTDTKADGNASARIDITRTSNTKHSVQFKQEGLATVAGKTYTLMFWAKSSNKRSIDYGIQQDHSPFLTYGGTSTNITTSWKKYSYTFTANATDSVVFLRFNMANTKGTVWLDGVSLTSN